MLVTERMQALGDHARSSRQPPVKERKYAKADANAAEQETVVEPVLEKDATYDSAAAVLVDDVRPQIATHESGNGTAAEITPEEEAAVRATVAAVLAKIEPQPAPADDSATPAKAVQQEAEGTQREHDDLVAAKRAIIHEWENWSALHSDELGDPNVAEYFFRHLQIKKIPVLNSCSSADQTLIESWFRETVGTECVSR